MKPIIILEDKKDHISRYLSDIALSIPEWAQDFVSANKISLVSSRYSGEVTNPARTLVIPYGFSAVQPERAKGVGQVITFGQSPKATVTFSSISYPYCLVSVTREIAAQDGSHLEPQEFPVKLVRDLDTTLALCAARLALGSNY
ncbi:MAG: hypothetical protein LBQ91_02220 [Oscillospiraceae bacterium]|jgi:hypothetical protein|nr:hypothetical protein [Oscillospiraceae bacterium]